MGFANLGSPNRIPSLILSVAGDSEETSATSSDDSNSCEEHSYNPVTSDGDINTALTLTILDLETAYFTVD